MPAYVANHEKKKRIFAKRERELLHAIQHRFALEKLPVAAEKLRAARIGVAKCKFTEDSEYQPHNSSAEQMAVKVRELQQWLSMSVDEIIELYRSSVGHEFNCRHPPVQG